MSNAFSSWWSSFVSSCRRSWSSFVRSSVFPWSQASSLAAASRDSRWLSDVMLCVDPARIEGSQYRCGRCLPCRFQKRRLWTSRLMLEAQLHEASFWTTLTYAEEFYPSDGSVSVREAQLFLKRLRERVSPCRLRYFIVGEYGDTTGRAHYHACLFGLRDAVAVSDAWGKGHVSTVPLTYELAQYTCGYTCKKMTNKADPRLKGREPEFARMSLRPGIGSGAVEVLRNALVDQETGEVRMGDDVPASIRVAGRRWPIGRYLRRALRRSLGMEASEPAVAREFRKWQEYVELEDWRALERREEKRIQSGRRAAALDSINRSKKGL